MVVARQLYRCPPSALLLVLAGCGGVAAQGAAPALGTAEPSSAAPAVASVAAIAPPAAPSPPEVVSASSARSVETTQEPPVADAKPPWSTAELIEEAWADPDTFPVVVDWRSATAQQRVLCGVKVERTDELLPQVASWQEFTGQPLQSAAEARAAICSDTCSEENCQDGCDQAPDPSMGCDTVCTGPAPWLALLGPELQALIPTAESRLLMVPVGSQDETMRYAVRARVVFWRAGDLFLFQTTQPQVETTGSTDDSCEYACTWGRLVARERDYQVVDRSTGRRLLRLRLPPMKLPVSDSFTTPEPPQSWEVEVTPLSDGVAIASDTCRTRIQLREPPPPDPTTED
jgi:hypothetical protein